MALLESCSQGDSFNTFPLLRAPFPAPWERGQQGCWPNQGLVTWSLPPPGLQPYYRLTPGDKHTNLHCCPVSGRALVRGPSSLMKKVELSEDQTLEAAMEESSTSLAPTLLFLTTLDAAPATEESLILPVTSLRPQVRGAKQPRIWKGLGDCVVQTPLSPLSENEARQEGGWWRPPGLLIPAQSCWALHPEGGLPLPGKKWSGPHSEDSQASKYQIRSERWSLHPREQQGSWERR
jgi:hypothetical protein